MSCIIGLAVVELGISCNSTYRLVLLTFGTCRFWCKLWDLQIAWASSSRYSIGGVLVLTATYSYWSYCWSMICFTIEILIAWRTKTVSKGIQCMAIREVNYDKWSKPDFLTYRMVLCVLTDLQQHRTAQPMDSMTKHEISRKPAMYIATLVAKLRHSNCWWWVGLSHSPAGPLVVTV